MAERDWISIYLRVKSKPVFMKNPQEGEIDK